LYLVSFAETKTINLDQLTTDHLQRWRLILGQVASEPGEEAELTEEQRGMDRVLNALYDSDREGGLGSSSPNVNRWLGDIRKYFPSPVVQVIQKDALDRLGLEKLLLEPELLAALEVDVHLAATLLSLNKVLPDKSRETAREIVRRVCKQLEERLRPNLITAISGALNRAVRNRRPRLKEINWPQTILRNLKHYQPELGTIIPEQLIGYGRKGPQLKHIILLMDQSGSMASSVVHAGVIACILASLRTVQTKVVAFDTSVVDLSDQLQDPVDLLFGVQLGGGTDIQQAIAYGRQLVTRPQDTIVVLLSDLFEGGRPEPMLQHIAQLLQLGCQFIALLALNDDGAPAFNKEVAQELARLNVPAFACTPDLFPDLMAAAMQRKDIRRWLGEQRVEVKN
jgi:Mg-chelatase subunit ChlD